jgi:hypothetical protein
MASCAAFAQGPQRPLPRPSISSVGKVWRSHSAPQPHLRLFVCHTVNVPVSPSLHSGRFAHITPNRQKRTNIKRLNAFHFGFALALSLAVRLLRCAGHARCHRSVLRFRQDAKNKSASGSRFVLHSGARRSPAASFASLRTRFSAAKYAKRHPFVQAVSAETRARQERGQVRKDTAPVRCRIS